MFAILDGKRVLVWLIGFAVVGLELLVQIRDIGIIE